MANEAWLSCQILSFFCRIFTFLKWRKLWKKKWVALHGTEIVYMDKEPTLENSSQLNITKAQITPMTEIVKEDVEGNPNGFAIHINDGHSPTWYLRAENSRDKNKWILRLGYVVAIVRWLGDFEKVKVLGVGGTGIVYELLHRTNGQRYAMKEMEIKSAHQMNMAVSEAEMLKDIMENVSHPNIMHIEKVFQVGSKFYLVFPLCTGGELYEHIIKRHHFTEHDAARLTRDLISGLHALHQHDILHLDIKPENLLFESNAEDAKIKITDFGLARIFTSETQGEKLIIPNTKEHIRKGSTYTAELMAEKMKAYLDSGELNADRIKGTVGYMSPELILTGQASKATDVFAAGVVLYILLSGRPPFNSNSNREVLEMSVKGQFKLSGAEWCDVSAEAKDLVKRMLTVYPEQRITTEEILKHPWICQLDGKDTPVADTEGEDGIAPLKSFERKSLSSAQQQQQQSSANSGNLTGALRLLSGHVKRLQSEKFATSVTRLVSSMQHSGNGQSSRLADIYLREPSATGSPPRTPNSVSSASTGTTPPTEPLQDERAEQDIMVLMNAELRSALTTAIENICKRNEGVDGEDGGSTGCVAGRLTVEQFMTILKHFSFTASNQNSNKLSVGALFFCRFIDRDGDGYITVDDMATAQALIMQRSEVFLKMVFRIYIESLWYPGRNMNIMNVVKNTPLRGGTNTANTAATVESEGGGNVPAVTPSAGSRILADNSSTLDVVEPPKFITARHVAAVFEKLGYDPAAGQLVFVLLSEAMNKKSRNHSVETTIASEDNREATTSTATSGQTSSKGSDESDELRHDIKALQLEDNNNSSSGKDANKGGGASGSSNASVLKMDFQEFSRAIEMDDIMLQVIFRKPRGKMLSLVRRASIKGSQLGVSASSIIEEELQGALNNTGNATGFSAKSMLSSVGRATLTAAFGLAAKVSSGSSSLIFGSGGAEGGNEGGGEEEDDEGSSIF